MTRSSTSPIAATAALCTLMIGVPLWLFDRVTSSLLPLRAADLALLVAMIAWSFGAKAVLDRDTALDSTAMNRTSPTWHAHRLVDASIFGVGFAAMKADLAAPSRLHLVAAPQALSADQLPPHTPAAQFARGDVALEEAGPRSIPMLHSDEPVAPSVPETHEYIVARGDTFWSIAEVVLGDGRDWQQLRDLNVGRQVAPDVVLSTNHELRIGWSILLPVISRLEEEANHVA